MTEVAESGGGKRVWRELRSNPDYVADWRAHSGEPAPLERAPLPLRAQTLADLGPATWACWRGRIREREVGLAVFGRRAIPG